MEVLFDRLVEAVRSREKKRVIICGEREEEALSAVFRAEKEGWVEPIGVGDSFRGMDWEINSLSLGLEEARKKAIELMKEEKGEVLLYTSPIGKGFFSLLMEEARGVNQNGVLSYVSLFSLPGIDRFTFFTDTLINPSPGLREKIGILENAIGVARRLGVERPRVAALSALELINPSIPSTLDGAVLSKMSERGQFGEAVVEGPLAMDNAASASAARHKGIISSVPGSVDIYLFPDLESAHLTSQFLVYMCGLQAAGILVGLPFPVVIRSPLERFRPWEINLALGCLIKG
ncbi:MAG: phosphate acyltransferase [Thermodesulfobacteriota bacterium]